MRVHRVAVESLGQPRHVSLGQPAEGCKDLLSYVTIDESPAGPDRSLAASVPEVPFATSRVTGGVMATIGLSPNGEARTTSNERADVVLVGTIRGIVRLERADSGWTAAERTLEDFQIAALLSDQPSGTIIAATLRPGGIFVSTDDGHTWSENRLSEPGLRVFSLSAQTTSEGLTIYAGCEPVRIYKSTNLGQSWTELPGIRSSETEFWMFPTPPRYDHLKHVGSHSSDAKTLYASIEQGALLESDDGGASWTEVESFLTPDDRFHADVHRVVVSPSNPDHLFMPTGEGFYRSVDRAKSWEHLLRSDARIAYPDPLFVHPRKPSTLFLAGAGLFPGDWSPGPSGTANPAILRSDDEGTTWVETMAGLPAPILGNLEAMSMHDSGDALMFVIASTQGEVYSSEDEGGHWSLIADGLPPVSKSLHFRKFLTDDERSRVEAEIQEELQRASATAV